MKKFKSEKRKNICNKLFATLGAATFMRNSFLMYLFFAALVTMVACKKKTTTQTPTPVTPPPSKGPYFPAVKTIIQNNCLSCHSSTGTWAGRPTAFDSDSVIAAQNGLIKTAIVGPWSVGGIQRMPQGGSLSQTQINTIVNWVNAGGKTTD
jgi:uncharacterized membrane protein